MFLNLPLVNTPTEDSALPYICCMKSPQSLLFVLATAAEACCLGVDKSLKPGFYLNHLGDGFSLLITGVGQVPTAYHLSKTFTENKFTAAINLGVAGALDHEIPLGTVVNITRDEFADLGAENGDEFLSLFNLELANANENPFSNSKLFPILFPFGEMGVQVKNIRSVTGASVNTVHGASASIMAFQKRSDAQIESMEGAAFFYACNMANVPSLQIRSISNYVEPRNRNNWRMDLALESLRIFIQGNFPSLKKF